MKKILFVDLDGIVLHRTGFFSERAKELYPEADHEAIKEFFVGGMYTKAVKGETALEDVLSQVLPGWKVEADVDEILKVWFMGENTIDDKVVHRIQEIRKAGISCVIATDHSQYRKNDVWEHLQMNKYFDGILASSDVHATKEEPQFFQRGMEILGVESVQHCMFTDDDANNVAVAESLGMRGVVFTGIDSLDEVSKWSVS